VAIGAYLNDGNGNSAGHVRVFKNVDNVWTQIGSDIDGEAAGDGSGRTSISLSSDGTIVAIGAIYNDKNGSNAGHVRVFKNVDNVWTQIGSDIDGEASNDFSGYSVSLSSDGTIVAIGIVGTGSSAGRVKVFNNVDNVWTQIGSGIDGEAANDFTGSSVSLSSDGTIVAIGARYNDGNGSDAGHVRVFKNVSGVWTQIGSDIDGEAAGDWSGGYSVSLSSDGTIVAIGANLNDGNGNRAGHVRVFNYDGDKWTQNIPEVSSESETTYGGLTPD
jgi:Flp pilus assembly pilin Flp